MTSYNAAILIKKKTLLSKMKNFIIDLRVFPYKDDPEKRYYYVLMDDNKYFTSAAYYVDVDHEKVFEREYEQILDEVQKTKLDEFIITIKSSYIEGQ